MDIDDIVNSKIQVKEIQGLNYNFYDVIDKSICSHCVVKSNFLTNNISIPLNYKPYISKINCEKYKRTFKGKFDIAIDFIKFVNKPFNCDKIYCLVDSWYTSQNKTIIEYYLNRWSIETNYKYFKTYLVYDAYKVESLFSIERYFLLVFLKINFFEIYRIHNPNQIGIIAIINFK